MTIRTIIHECRLESGFHTDNDIHIHLPEDQRMARVLERGREDDTVTEEAFRARDERELSWGLAEVLEEADVVISNTGTRQELRLNVAYLLSDIFTW